MNSGYVYRSRAQSEDAGRSVLAYHLAHFAHTQRDGWESTIAAGLVRVNGRVATCELVLRAGDLVEFHRPPWEEPHAPLDFRVVHEDESVLVVEKPSGLQVLPAGPFLEHTLWHQVRASALQRADASPVHRLGRGTSGLVLFGLTREARSSLSRQFRANEPCKTYLALVRGTELRQTIQARHPIGPMPHGALTVWCVRPDGAGKASHTRIRVLERDRARDRSLVAAQPITGRPDQIRVHLAACGAPIVGDELFAPGGGIASDVTPGHGGYFLHAAGLRFLHPTSGSTLKLRSRPAWLAS